MTRRGLFGAVAAILGVGVLPRTEAKASQIIRVGMRQGAIAGAAPVYRISLQEWDYTPGFPVPKPGIQKKTLIGFSKQGNWMPLDEPVEVRAGDTLLVEYAAGTIDAGMVR